MIISKIKYIFEFILKQFFNFINVKYLSYLALILRKILINTLINYKLINFSKTIDLIYHKKELKTINAIIIINGGGFIIDDNTDLIVGIKLLNLMESKPIILSLKYKTFDDLEKINNDIIKDYNFINNNYNLLGIISSSASALLILNLMSKIKINCKIIFLSPWLNLKNNIDSNKDYVSINGINKINNLINIKTHKLDKIIYYPKIYIISGQDEILLNESKILFNKFNNSELIIVYGQSHAFLTAYGLFNTKLQNKILQIIINLLYCNIDKNN
jgi:hypothetical protein